MELSRVERLENDVDLRLGSLWAELLRKPLREAELPICAAFMRLSYVKGYVKGQEEPRGVLSAEIGAEPEGRLARVEAVVDLRLVELWPELLEKGLPSEVLPLAAVFCRAAYVYGYYDGQDESIGLLDVANGYPEPPRRTA